jgi:aldose 1-epimerase
VPHEALLELDAGVAHLEVLPHAGGRISRLAVAGIELLRSDPTPTTLLWGCYPMVPWAGRVRHGRFEFDGTEFRLPLDAPPHAIHGTGHLAAWEVTDAGRDHCELRCTLDWPLGGTAHQHIVLRPDGVTLLLSVLATERMPAVVGWHPCFHPPRTADLRFGRMYRRDDEGIAVAELVDVPDHPWDDCFVEPVAPPSLTFTHPDGRPEHGLTVTLTSDCDHWVVFDELPVALCVEPQSAPPDACNLGSAHVLGPGDLLQRRFDLHWSTPPTHR